MSEQEAKDFMVQETMYSKFWSKCKINCQRAPQTSLQKELKIAVERFTEKEKEAVIQRQLELEMNFYRDTDYPMSEEVFEKKLANIMKLPLSAELSRDFDIKWRHPTHRWAIFNKFLPTMEKIFANNQNLQEHIFGDMNFKFDPLWIESRTEFMKYQKAQIARCEKIENMQYQSGWDLFLNIQTYCLDGRLPLRDPFRT